MSYYLAQHNVFVPCFVGKLKKLVGTVREDEPNRATA